MIYTKYNGQEAFVTLPSHEGSEPYTGIGPKAFLSHKEIYKLVLPATIETIDDWAFAHMHNLTELVMPANSIHFGKKVFLDCDALQQLHVTPDLSGNPGLPFFLASAVTVFSDMSLLKLKQAASATGHKEWMARYDEQLIAYLTREDTDGFEPVFYGWFNDEDAEISQRPKYIQKQRSNKVRLSFLRLRFDLHLEGKKREILQAYLRDHMPWGSQATEHTAVWDALPGDYARDIEYYRILEEAGALNPGEIPRLIDHISQADTEVIAYLLRYQEKHRKVSDFFDNFSL